MIRAIDQVRAQRLVIAALTEDYAMYGAVVEDILCDPYGLGGAGCAVNVMRALSEDLAGFLTEINGRENAVALVQQILLNNLAKAEPIPDEEPPAATAAGETKGTP